ncbi:MAG: hypothetical protein ILA22_00855, partial [Prevotella sp.]|nr:hypothetical protein [Prevotella sp.]
SIYYMEQKSSITGCAMNAALETTLAVELFLNENYCFRRNVLNGKVETSTDKRRAPLSNSKRPRLSTSLGHLHENNLLMRKLLTVIIN